MKKILLALVFVFSFIAAQSQTQPSGLPSPRSDSGFAQYNWIRALNGGVIFPARDTLFTPTYIGTVIFWRNPASDTALWVYAATAGRRWFKVVTVNNPIAPGTGTVTSIATNNGTGITGGAITTSGTLVIDTLNISTRAWRQKGIDSVVGVLNSGYVKGIPISINDGVLKWNGTTGTQSKKSNLIIEDYFDIDASLVEMYGGVDSFGNGREVSLNGSDATVGTGGAAFLTAGLPANGDGSNAGIYASRGIGTNRNGGSLLFNIGGKTGSGTNGSIQIDVEPDSLGFTTLKRGHIRLDNLTTTPNGTINARTWQMPNASGTFALQGDTTGFGTKFIYNQTGSNLSAQTAKIWISDTIRTSGVVRADNNLRTDSIRSSTLKLSGDLLINNSSTVRLRGVTGAFLDASVLQMTSLDTLAIGNDQVPTVYYGANPIRFQSGTFRQQLQSANGVIALTSNVTDSSAALRASINTKLNISDTAAMLAGVSLDRVLANGNTSGRAATVGAFTATTGYFSSDLTSAARIRSDKAFFNSSATTALDTVVSVRGLSNAQGIVSVTSGGQAIRGVATGGATAITALSQNINGTALDIANTAGGRLIAANNGTLNVLTVENNGKLTTLDSIVGVNQRLTGTLTATASNGHTLGTSSTATTPITIFSNSGGAGLRIVGRNNAPNDEGSLAFFKNDNTTLNGGFRASNSALELIDGSNTTFFYGTGGNAYSSSVYNATVGATNRDVFVDNTGLIGYVSSFRASKKNIKPLSTTSWIHKLNPVEFNYRKKDSTGKYTDSAYKELEYGLIAEEVEPINKEMVFYDVDSTGKHLRGVHYSKLIIPLLKEVQEQKKTITELEARLARLEELLKIKP